MFEINEYFDILCQAMKNKKKSQDADKYGKIPPSEELKLLIGIIGRDAILDLIPKKNRISYEGKLQRINEGKIPYHNVVILQRCCEKFFKEIESNYEVSPLVNRSLISSLISNLHGLLWNFSLYAKSNRILDMSKNEIAIYLLHEQASHYIYDDSSKEDCFSELDMNVFKTSEGKVLEFLTDSYKIVFDEIMQEFKNKEAFYKVITGLGEDYKENINNWQNGEVYNPYWRTLVPILDYLYKQEHIAFVYRLIGLYLRKNAQEVFAGVLSVSKDELKEIIEKTVNMIRDKKCPEKICSALYFDGIWFKVQRIGIAKCLGFQNNYENSIDVIDANNFIEYLKRNYLRSSEEKFLYFWLQTRAKVFEKYSDIKDDKTQEEILGSYKEAFNELLKDIEGSPFLKQFLAEIILINYFFHPRRKKAINYYYEYGCTLEVFCADKKKMILNHLKEFRNKDIRKTLVDIHNHFCCIKISS